MAIFPCWILSYFIFFIHGLYFLKGFYHKPTCKDYWNSIFSYTFFNTWIFRMEIQKIKQENI